MPFEHARVFRAGVLRSAVQVMDEARERLPFRDRLVARSNRQTARQGPLQCSADHFPRVAVENHSQVEGKSAVAAMDQAIKLDPSKVSNYLDVGAILLEHDRPNGALLAAQAALQADPRSPDAYYLKGQAEKQIGALKDAVKSYSQSLALDPASHRALLALALGQAAAAKAAFEKGIKQFPGNALFYQEYGRMLLRLVDDPASESRAASLFETAIRLDGSLAEPHYELGSLDLRKGNLQQSPAQLQTAARLQPDRAAIHYALATVCRRLERRDDAKRELQIFARLKTQQHSSHPSKRR